MSAADKPTVLLQLDADPQPSSFDAMVAIDAGVDRLLAYGGVERGQVQSLVHGVLFTRGPSELHRTAIFVGGSSVAKAEELFAEVRMTFFDPFRVSVLLDPNGANTTACAAALSAIEGVGGSLSDTRAVVLGGTGPVGQRVARLLAFQGAKVWIGSREHSRAGATAKSLSSIMGVEIGAIATDDADLLSESLGKIAPQVIVSAGAPGAVLLPLDVRKGLRDLRAVIDLNAVPPLGVEGIKASDKAANRDGSLAWGALGVGGLKMKIHKKAVQQLFLANDQVFDAEEVFEVGKKIGK